MTPEPGDNSVLPQELKEELAKDIKINGGSVPDPDFAELEKYLELNPPDEQ